MKKFITTSILALLVAAGTALTAKDRPDEYLGLPGDNLNLYAVMKLFQESETLEGFERSLNDNNSRINNLDLNGDNLIDYIMVIDYPDGDVHNIVLQVALNRNEKQDVAVFTVQQFRNGNAQIQLIGDEALYGRNYIIEPIYADNYGETPNPGYYEKPGYSGNTTVVRYTTYDIAAWPLVRFIYLPTYVTWHSSWYWGYYPSYWHPWRPYYWDYYYGYHYNWYNDYYRHYRHWEHPRYTRYNDFYYSRVRSHSPQVSHRIREGSYKTTYSHPEQRRDGKALYSREHSGQKSRRTADIETNNTGRRTISQTTNERTSAGTSRETLQRSKSTTERTGRTISTSAQRPDASNRSTAAVSKRNRTNTDPVQKATSNSKSTNTISERNKRNAYTGSKTEVAPRSAVPSTERINTKPNSIKKASTSSRATATASNKATPRTEPGYRTETARAPKKATSGVRSSKQGSSRESKTATPVKRRTDTKESENSKSSRRR